MKNLIIAILIFLTACAPSEGQVQTAIARTEAARPTATGIRLPTETSTQTVTQTPTLTATLTPTITPTNTNTPESTSTPAPTMTLFPTSTPTPRPTPILLKGVNGVVVDINKWRGAALMKISYKGGGSFSIKNYAENGELIDRIVSKSGNYEGNVPLDIASGDQTARLEINSSGGTWEISILPFNGDNVRVVAPPGKDQR